jgi:tetratricopeptide (TPR) repeat protein
MNTIKRQGYIVKLFEAFIFTFIASPFFFHISFLFNGPYSASLIFLCAAAAFAVIIWAVKAVSGGSSFTVTPFVLITAGFAAAAALSGIGIQGMNRTVFFDRYVFLICAVIIAACVAGIDREKFIYKLAVFMSVISAAASVFGLVQFSGFLFRFNIPLSGGNIFKFRVYSLLGNPDMMTAFCLASMPFTALLFHRERNPFYLGVLIINTAVVILTGSLSGIIILCVQSAVIVIMMSGKKIMKVITAAILCLVIAAGIWAAGQQKDMAVERELLRQSALLMALDHPALGAGLGSFSMLSPGYQLKTIEKAAYPDTVQPHDAAFTNNDYLQILAETGFIGLLFFIVAVLYPFFSVIRRGLNGNQDIFILLSMGGMAAYGFFNPVFCVPLTAIIYIIAGAAITADEKVKTPFAAIPAVFIPAVCSLVIIFIFIPKYYARNYLAQYFTYEINRGERPDTARYSGYIASDYQLSFLSGLAKNREGDYQGAEKYFERSLELYPYFITAKYNMANSYMNSGDRNKAAGLYTEITGFVKDYAPAYNNIAVIYIDNKDYERAAEALRTGIKYDPKFVNLHLNLARVLYFEKKYQEALTEVAAALAIDRKAPGAMELIDQISGAVNK